jgi:hypothetical protein
MKMLTLRFNCIDQSNAVLFIWCNISFLLWIIMWHILQNSIIRSDPDQSQTEGVSNWNMLWVCEGPENPCSCPKHDPNFGDLSYKFINWARKWNSLYDYVMWYFENALVHTFPMTKWKYEVEVKRQHLCHLLLLPSHQGGAPEVVIEFSGYVIWW